MTLAQLIKFFDAKVIASWSPAGWAVVLAKIKANRGRFGLGQW